MIEQFRDFTASKPAAETYDYDDCFNCAFSQFLKAAGFAERPSCSFVGWWDKAKPQADRHPLPDGVESAVWVSGKTSKWTFGALTERLNATLSAGKEDE